MFINPKFIHINMFLLQSKFGFLGSKCDLCVTDFNAIFPVDSPQVAKQPGNYVNDNEG